MLLAHLLHRELETRAAGSTTLARDDAADLDGLALADAIFERALDQTREAHQANWDALSAGKKAVLASLADGVRPTGSRATERSGLSRAALQSALRELGREGQHVARVKTGPDSGPNWRFVDPLVRPLGLPARSASRLYRRGLTAAGQLRWTCSCASVVSKPTER